MLNLFNKYLIPLYMGIIYIWEMKIKDVRKELGISNSWIAEIMGYSNVKSYNKSAGKKRIEKLIVEIYKKINLINIE